MKLLPRCSDRQAVLLMPRDGSEGHHLSVSLTVSCDLQDSSQCATVSSLALQTCVPSSNLDSGSEDNPTKGLTPAFYRPGGSKVSWVAFDFMCFGFVFVWRRISSSGFLR